MDLKKALEIQVEFFGKDGTIRVDENGYLCLNDLNTYFPNKRIQNWLDNEATKELIASVENILIHSVSSELESFPAIIGKRGRFKSGTYAHELIAMDFAAWLSVEFRIHVYQSYINGTQHKQNWNIKRILAANNYRLMCDAVKNAHDSAKHYHFSNEAKMLNTIVFGQHEPDVRDTAGEAQLDAIAWLESHNAALIDLGMNYEDRKTNLSKMYSEKYLPEHRVQLGVAS